MGRSFAVKNTASADYRFAQFAPRQRDGNITVYLHIATTQGCAAADDGRFFDIAFFYPALYRLGVAETSQREYSRQSRPREGRAVRLRAGGYQQLVVALSISFPAGLDRYELSVPFDRRDAALYAYLGAVPFFEFLWCVGGERGCVRYLITDEIGQSSGAQ